MARAKSNLFILLGLIIAFGLNIVISSASRITDENEALKTQLKKVSTELDTLKAIDHNTLIDPAILRAIIQIESSGNHQAEHKSGAVGLMQLRPIVYNGICGLSKEEAFVPEKNIACGSLYLKYLLNKYRGNLEKALEHYNNGNQGNRKYPDKIVNHLCKGDRTCQKQLLSK